MIWSGDGIAGGPSRCKRSCCWSPFGHSTVRDGLSEWRRCKCHDAPPEPVEESLVRLRDPFDGDDAA